MRTPPTWLKLVLLLLVLLLALLLMILMSTLVQTLPRCGLREFKAIPTRFAVQQPCY